ncbi:replisome organizer [Acidaminococcus fermentans]|uniref:replisome organizer n=1 Tax=Acidaminococcus fermentans TaxID=905 RepID=UPI003F8C62C0
MAERRMMAKSVIDTDQFMDMPATAQNLYFHLLLRADDDGFLSNVKQVQRMTGNKDDDLKILFAKQYLIPFESGVVVIKHWKIHNYIQKDRYHPSRLPEKEEVEVNNYGEWEKKSVSSVSNMYPDCIQHVSIGKDRLGKDRLGKDRKDIKPSRHRYGEYKNVLLTDTDVEKLKNEFPNDWDKRIERLSAYMASTGKSYKNHLATIRNWARMQKERDEKSRAAEVKQFAGNEDEEWKKQDDELHELMKERGWL